MRMAIKRETKHPHFPTSMALQLQELSEARREIIRPVLEGPREFVLLNVRDMARRLETGPATVVRIVRALGFDTYKDFQHYLHYLSVSSATILDSMQAGGTHGDLQDPPRLTPPDSAEHRLHPRTA